MIKSVIIIRILNFLMFFQSHKTGTSFVISEITNRLEPKSEEDLSNKIGFQNKYFFNPDKTKSKDYIDINEIQETNLLKRLNLFNEVNQENFKNKILVKRILPHGILPTGIEYDHKFNTIYKPLMRVHKIKDLNQFYYDKYDDDFHNIILDGSISDYGNLELKETQNDKDSIEMSDGYIFSNNRLKLVAEILKKIKGVKSKAKRLKIYDKLIKVLNRALRTQFEKSGEANDPYAPGKHIVHDDNEQASEKPKKWLPHYPPWNYWTYKKSIHQDECPGDQVKIGNMCIWTPPH